MSAELFPKGAAIIAGGSGGIGRGICECLAEQGSDVAILYRSKEGPAQDLVVALQAKGVKAQAWKVDLQEAAAVASVMAEAAEAFGRIHTAVYAAGPAITINFLSRIPPEEFARIVSADVLACYNFVHAALAPIKAGGGGALIGITTNQLERPDLRGSMSSIPKAAVDKMFQLATRLASIPTAMSGLPAAITTLNYLKQIVVTKGLSPRFAKLVDDIRPNLGNGDR
jgi:NAD(P)-dependent dehydrogenase (short-subunit alcohol dehydrogenase family)